MNSYTNTPTPLEHQRSRLESLVSQADYTTLYHPRRLGTLLARLGHRLTNWLTSDSMPRIQREQQGDRNVWRVYDPIADRTLYFDHEEALRTWMDQRYYEA